MAVEQCSKCEAEVCFCHRYDYVLLDDCNQFRWSSTDLIYLVSAAVTVDSSHTTASPSNPRSRPSLQADNHASTPPLSFLQAGCPSCHPTNSIKALKALTTNRKSQIHRSLAVVQMCIGVWLGLMHITTRVGSHLGYLKPTLKPANGHASTKRPTACHQSQLQEGDPARPHLCKFARHKPLIFHLMTDIC